MNLLELLNYFLIYSFLGWLMESTFRSFCEKKLINTGFLKGPFCPIYGIGAIIMFLFLKNFSNNYILLFFISVFVLTIWEYIVGIILEKLFNTKYWDYSDHKFNFQGRICLTNSIYWGILGILFVKYIHPFIKQILSFVNMDLLNYIIAILFVAFLTDMIYSIINVKNIKATLEKVENINQEIKEKINELRKLNKQKGENTNAHLAESTQKVVNNLKKKRDRIILRLYKNVHRLKMAFPAINTKEITEVLNQKIESRKKRIKNKQKGLK